MHIPIKKPWNTTEKTRHYFVSPQDPFGIAYTWDPIRLQRVNAKKLIELGTITTYHAWGYYGFFKPSYSDVIAAIPSALLDMVRAFEIVDQPREASDMSKTEEIRYLTFDVGVHVATTKLYDYKGK